VVGEGRLTCRLDLSGGGKLGNARKRKPERVNRGCSGGDVRRGKSCKGTWEFILPIRNSWLRNVFGGDSFGAEKKETGLLKLQGRGRG